MFRIDHIKPSAGHIVLKVAGQITWETAATLEGEARRWLQQQQRLVLALDEVDFIDTVGIDLLKGLVQQGVPLRGASRFTQILLARHGLDVER